MKIYLLPALLLLHFSILSQVTLQTNITEQGKTISPDLIGVFFEDINYAADGGLYAELIQNRSFEYYLVEGYVDLEPLHAWTLVQEGGAEASMAIENSNPLNSSNTKYLALNITNKGTRAGIKNSGFDGIPVALGETYKYSVYLRSQTDFNNPVVVKIKSSVGLVIGTDTIKNINSNWVKYSGEITCTNTSDKATFSIETDGTGTIYIDMVSLFPQNTYKNRENGLRKDLAKAIADLKPRFLRFPGGCISHGRGISNAYRWKETIGDVAERAPNWNLWGYHQTYGLGFYEYFLFCEDIDAIPLPVIPVGVSCQFRNREIVPISEMGPWVEDALDLVEFANGDISTTWGSKRAEMGHPEPFNMEYLCLGNEEDDIPEFRVRFKMIADSLKKYHPEIKIIGTSGTSHSGTNYDGLWQFSTQEQLSAVDEHFYVQPEWLLNNNHRYDNFDRNGPKVFVGEYASWDDLMKNAIAEASFLTGIERNADVVQFTCYAPLLCNENHQQWHPDLIRFNHSNVIKTANYYIQQLFSHYTGDMYFESNLTYEENSNPLESTYFGKIGVATWNTQAQFDDVKVINGDETLVEMDFSSSASNWSALSGSFSISNGSYVQSSANETSMEYLFVTHRK